MSAEFEYVLTLEVLEARDYKKWVSPKFAGRIEHAIRRDRIAYYLLQMREFWSLPPYDLPPWYDGRQYSVWMLQHIDMGTPDLQNLHDLLTSLEADVVVAAQTRGFRLKRRPSDDNAGFGDHWGTSRRRKRGNGHER